MYISPRKIGSTIGSRLHLAGASRCAVAAGLLPLSFYAMPALAQAEEGASAAGNEIVVTAQFRDQSVQDIPIAITAVTGEMLEARGQTNVIDIAQQAPSVSLQVDSQNGPALQAYIRGIGQGDSNFAFEPGVGIYVDDVYYSTLTGSVLDLVDLDRVEILRGPQGTLAGMNSIGGAIKLYSTKPGREGGYVEAGVGSRNRLDLRGAADFALIPDRLFARIAGVARKQDGYVTRYDFACTHPELASDYNIPSLVSGDNCKLGTEGGRSYIAGRGSLFFQATDRLELNVSADFTRDDSEASPQTLLFVGATTPNGGYEMGTGSVTQTYPMWSTAPENGLTLWNPITNTSPFLSYSPIGGAGDTFSSSPYINYATYGDARPIDGSAPFFLEPISQVNGWGLSAKIDYELSDTVDLTSITAYRTHDADWSQDNDATNLSNAVMGYNTSSWQFSQEVRLAARLFDDSVDLVVGGFYLDRESRYAATVDQGALIFYGDDRIPASNWAAFTNVSWRLSDRLELNAGARYSEETKSFEFTRLGRPGASAPPYFPCSVDGVDYGNVHVAFCGLNGAVGDYSGNNVDYRGVVQYRWSPSLMTYASVATGFKGGGVNPRPYTSNQARPFDPEKLVAYEIGVKSDLFSRRLRVNASVFHNNYSDFIAYVLARATVAPNQGCFFAPEELNCGYVVNAGEATLRGIEVELQAEPIDGLTFDASGSLLDFKYDELSGCSPELDSSCQAPSGGLGAGIRYGMTLPSAPKRKLSVGMQYYVDLDRAGSLTPRLDFSYTSDQEQDTINNALARVPAYSLLNGGITWRSYDDDLQVSLQVYNLTNNLHYISVSQNDATRMVWGTPGRPREWSLSVRRSF